MVSFFRLFYAILLKGIRTILDNFILILPIYYTRIDKISIARWFEIIDGNVNKLYKVNFINYVPIKFVKIAENMYFQLDKIDTSIIEKEKEIALLNSLAARTKNKVMKFNADSLKNELDKKKESLSRNKSQKLNEFLNYIEATFNNIGSLDPDKLKASRAYSLFYLAIEKNKQLANVSN